MSGYLLFKKKLSKVSSDQFSCKNNCPVLLFKSIFRYGNCFLSSLATDGKDGHGLKLEKIGPTFQVLMLCLQRIFVVSAS